MAIRFTFDERKATATAARIIKSHGGGMDMIRLVKIAYLTERESLRRFNRPVFGDSYFSLEHGPVTGRLYDLAKFRPVDQRSLWAQHIGRQPPWTMTVVSDPDAGCLSPADIDAIDAVCDRHAGANTGDLIELTHRLPEWSDPGRSSTPIQAETLMRLLGKSDEELEKLQAEEEASSQFDLIFRRPS